LELVWDLDFGYWDFMPDVITIKINTILSLKKVLGQRELELSLPPGSTVKDLIAWMISTWGDKLSPHVQQPGSDSLLPHIRLMINGRSIEFLNGMETVLQDGDEFLMLPLVAGG
jgi:molybdopterin synthase sulfur carrier subunit